MHSCVISHQMTQLFADDTVFFLLEPSVRTQFFSTHKVGVNAVISNLWHQTVRTELLVCLPVTSSCQVHFHLLSSHQWHSHSKKVPNPDLQHRCLCSLSGLFLDYGGVKGQLMRHIPSTSVRERSLGNQSEVRTDSWAKTYTLRRDSNLLLMLFQNWLSADVSTHCDSYIIFYTKMNLFCGCKL